MDSKGKNYRCTFKTSLFISSHNDNTHNVTKSCQALRHEIGFLVMHLLVYLFCYLPSLLHFQASDNLRCDRTFRRSETLVVKCQGTFPKCTRTTCCKTIIQAPKCTIMHQASEWRCASILCVILHACFFKHVNIYLRDWVVVFISRFLVSVSC